MLSFISSQLLAHAILSTIFHAQFQDVRWGTSVYIFMESHDTWLNQQRCFNLRLQAWLKSYSVFQIYVSKISTSGNYICRFDTWAWWILWTTYVIYERLRSKSCELEPRDRQGAKSSAEVLFLIYKPESKCDRFCGPRPWTLKSTFWRVWSRLNPLNL